MVGARHLNIIAWILITGVVSARTRIVVNRRIVIAGGSLVMRRVVDRVISRTGHWSVGRIVMVEAERLIDIARTNPRRKSRVGRSGGRISGRRPGVLIGVTGLMTGRSGRYSFGAESGQYTGGIRRGERKVARLGEYSEGGRDFVRKWARSEQYCHVFVNVVCRYADIVIH